MFRARSQSNIGDSEREAKFVQERLDAVEKFFAELCTVFAAYTRKAARLRDKNDQVSKAVFVYAGTEEINRSTGACLLNFADTLSVIGDYRDAKVQRLNTNIILPLVEYQSFFKRARDRVKDTFAAQQEELKRKRLLEKISQENPKNQQKITQARSNYIRAAVDVAKVVKDLEEQIYIFEKQKIHDLKKIILNFITIQLSFHAKAIELFTKAYQDVAAIDEAQDLKNFRETMRSSELLPRVHPVKRSTFRKAQSLISIRNPFSSINLRKQKLKKTSESSDSLKSSPTNSSDSVQVEEFGDSSEESELEESSSSNNDLHKSDEEDKPTNIHVTEKENKNKGRFIFKMIPDVPKYQKNLSSPLIQSFNYSR